MTTPYTVYDNLVALADSDAQKIDTTSLFHNRHFSAMLLTIPAGHTLKEHVSPKILTLHIIAGTGSITVNSQTHAVQPGAWFYIEPNLPHALISEETLTVLLSLYTLPQRANGGSANA